MTSILIENLVNIFPMRDEVALNIKFNAKCVWHLKQQQQQKTEESIMKLRKD